MPVSPNIVINRENSSAVFHFTANVAGVVVAGNNSVSNVAIAEEVITGVTIAQAAYGSTPGAYWHVQRGSNTAVVLDSTGFIDFAGIGMPINKDIAADISVTLVPPEGSAVPSKGFLVLEVQKQNARLEYLAD